MSEEQMVVGGNLMDDELVVIDYTNHRGDRSHRTVRPIKIRFGANEWHPEPQWLLTALDMGKGAIRSFAMKDIHSWKCVPTENSGIGAECAGLQDEVTSLRKDRDRLDWLDGEPKRMKNSRLSIIDGSWGVRIYQSDVPVRVIVHEDIRSAVDFAREDE
jgi:hypothetical protein